MATTTTMAVAGGGPGAVERSPELAPGMSLLLRCQVGRESYAFEMSEVASVQRGVRLTRKPMPDRAIGVLEGTDVPIHRLGDLLERGAEAGEREALPGIHSQILIMRSARGFWGLEVDAVSRVLAVDRSRYSPIPPLATLDPRSPVRALLHARVFEEDPRGGRAEDDDEDENARFVYLLSQRGLRALVDGTVAEISDRTRGRIDYELGGLPKRGAAGGRLLLMPVGNEEDRAAIGAHPYLAMSISQIAGILEKSEISPIPMAARHVVGLINWRGRPLAVFDLAEWLGLSGMASRSRTRLVVAWNGRETIFAFPSLPGIHTMNLPTPSRPWFLPEGYPVRRLLGVFRAGDHLLMVPDIDQVGRGEEIERVVDRPGGS